MKRTIICILAAALGTQARAAEFAATSIKVNTGSKDGKVAALAAADEGSVVSLYTNRRGNLNVQFGFQNVSGANLKVEGVLLQKNAGDRFSLELRDGLAWRLLGRSDGGAQGKISFSLPEGAAGDLKIRITAAGADDAELDRLVVSSEGTAPPPTEPPPVPPPQTGIMLPPAGKISWDWQIGASGDASIAAPAGVKLMDVDGFGTSAAKVAQLRAQGIYMVCYINAGSYQPGYPDSAQYPAYLKLQKDPNWPGEYFLDVTDVFKPNSVLAAILRARIQMCKDKGFQAVEPDNLQNDENISGGLITTKEQIDFNGWIADTAHELGLAVFQKNGPDKVMLKDRTGKMMVEKFDGILNEECQQYNECAPLAEYVKRGKLALNVEYKQNPNCSLSNQLNINTIRKDLNLAGATMSGYKRVTCP